ncbi:MAG: cytochrome c oxidase subunit II [Myxococcales bacterium]|nr:cytochrome c oxidase subunit II [Myxococcales bacterium]
MQPQPQPATFQLPAQMAVAAEEIDYLYYFVYWFSVVFFVGIVGVSLYFLWKYKRRPGQKPEHVPDPTKLELFWTITPVLFIGYLFHASFSAYIKQATAAEGAMEIRVRARKWAWDFEYPNGSREGGQLYLPVNKPVKLVMSSDDVIHSFYVPAFRAKRDAVPGLYSHLAFTPNVKGEAQVYCAEFCGTSHSGMLAKIIVVDEEQYKKHLDELDKMPEKCGEKPCTPATWGEQLFVKNGCPSCHSRDGSKSLGPSLKGVFGTPQPIAGSGPVTADENYLRESILRPNAKIVEGYTTVQMPPFVFKDPQVDAIIAYLKTLK